MEHFKFTIYFYDTAPDRQRLCYRFDGLFTWGVDRNCVAIWNFFNEIIIANVKQKKKKQKNHKQTNTERLQYPLHRAADIFATINQM